MAMSRPRAVSATEFKARCLGLLERVARTGEPLVVTRRGRPVAKVVPVEVPAPRHLRGSVTVHADVVGPILDSWDLDR
jgi:prevent-host-death family protein